VTKQKGRLCVITERFCRPKGSL